MLWRNVYIEVICTWAPFEPNISNRCMHCMIGCHILQVFIMLQQTCCAELRCKTAGRQSRTATSPTAMPIMCDLAQQKAMLLQETFVVMEWCDRGSLESAVSDGVFHLHQTDRWHQQANMPLICATLLDISAGMAYLHKMHILHCDLKLRNALLKSSQASISFTCC